MAWHDHTDRFDLIYRGIGTVATTAEGVEQDFAFELSRQASGKRRVTDAAAQRLPTLLQVRVCSQENVLGYLSKTQTIRENGQSVTLKFVPFGQHGRSPPAWFLRTNGP